MIRRFFHDTSGSYFLFGPRGTGKSTWLASTFPDALVFDLLSPDQHRSLSARPERLAEAVAARPKKSTVVIDEIQKCPALLDVVHMLLERDEGLRFILTGSSARKLRRGGVNLLAGRALNRSLHPFMAAELGDDFSLSRAMREGMVPLVREAADPALTLSAYVGLYLKEEVQSEGLVRNIGNFSRFLEVASFSHGSLLNASQIARDCQVGRKTVEGYLDIAEDLLLAFRIPAFKKRAKRLLTSHPKFYFFDAGVYQSLRPRGVLDAPAEIGGAALEGLVAQHLRAWIDCRPGRAELSYWRTKSGVEVDFIVYGDDVFRAFEVKSSSIVSNRDLRGLNNFLEDYPEAEACFLYGGKEDLRIGRVNCIPVDTFLKSLVP